MACPCSPSILRDGQAIDATTKKKYALVGQKINLSLSGCAGTTITEIVWTVPGGIFKEFQVTTSPPTYSGVVVPVDSFSGQSSISFVWKDSGTSRLVQISFKANGEPCSAQASFDVFTPSVEIIETSIGETQCWIDKAADPDRRMVGLVSSTGAKIGLVWKAKVKVDTSATYGFSEGVWNFVSIIEAGTVWRKKSYVDGVGLVCYEFSSSGQKSLDGAFPYYSTDYATSNTTESFGDSPSDNLEISNLFEVYDITPFTTFIIFKPTGTGSQWVSLRKLAWSYELCSKRCDWGWQLLQSNETLGSVQTTTDHPTWNREFFGSGAWAEGTCPSCGNCGTGTFSCHDSPVLQIP